MKSLHFKTWAGNMYLYIASPLFSENPRQEKDNMQKGT